MIRSALRVPSLAAQKMMKKHPYRFQVFSHCGRHTPPDVGQDGPRRRGAVPPGDAPLTAGHPAAGRRGESRPSRTGPRRRPCCRRRRRPRTREDMLRALGFVCVCLCVCVCARAFVSCIYPVDRCSKILSSARPPRNWLMSLYTPRWILMAR